MIKFSRLFTAIFLAVAVSLAMVGCSDSDSGDGGGGNAKFTGTWALSQGAGVYWYITFNSDNSWFISNNADGSGRRAFGTYAVSGNTARGPMQNPGTGTGEIVATVSGSTMALDFIEHWHTPYKTLKFTGVKI